MEDWQAVLRLGWGVFDFCHRGGVQEMGKWESGEEVARESAG